MDRERGKENSKGNKNPKHAKRRAKVDPLYPAGMVAAGVTHVLLIYTNLRTH